MADAKKCDRCSILYEKIPSPSLYAVLKGTSIYLESKRLLDLCPKCESALDDWLHELEVENK